MKFLTKFRRDRWRDQVIVVGKQIRHYESLRFGVDSQHWPDDAAYLDSMINHYTRKRDRLLTKLKETA